MLVGYSLHTKTISESKNVNARNARDNETEYREQCQNASSRKTAHIRWLTSAMTYHHLLLAQILRPQDL
jgi:hypothetical protein